MILCAAFLAFGERHRLPLVPVRRLLLGVAFVFGDFRPVAYEEGGDGGVVAPLRPRAGVPAAQGTVMAVASTPGPSSDEDPV